MISLQELNLNKIQLLDIAVDRVLTEAFPAKPLTGNTESDLPIRERNQVIVELRERIRKKTLGW